MSVCCFIVICGQWLYLLYFDWHLFSLLTSVVLLQRRWMRMKMRLRVCQFALLFHCDKWTLAVLAVTNSSVLVFLFAPLQKVLD